MSSRRTTTPAQGVVTLIPALDGLRAVAAGMVVLTHAAYLTGVGVGSGLTGRMMARGDFGVAIFFALSGFLLHRGLVADDRDGRLDVVGYAFRRAARILPAYWIALAVVVVASHPSARDSLIHAAGLQIYWSDAWISDFGQSWSIATEIAFYAALPFVVLALRPLRRRRPALPLIVLAILAVALTLTSGLGGGGAFGEDVLYERWLHARAPHFLVGMICAEALLVPGHAIARRLTSWGSDAVMCLAVAGAAYLMATAPITGSLTLEPATPSQLVVRTALSAVIALGLLLPLTHGGPSAYRAVLSRPVVRWLGVTSYGLFLWHLPVFEALYAVTGASEFAGGLLPLLAVGLPISLLLAALSHHWIEVPSSRLAGRLLARRRQRQRDRPEDKESHRPLDSGASDSAR
ncbi:acyltransferase [Knoellia sp. S7-12]|uniref:acyltransferase family protein n=1 Tax=Knoellia sp. S7-12 TaxID=3126698 RepID=UPI003367648F